MLAQDADGFRATATAPGVTDVVAEGHALIVEVDNPQHQTPSLVRRLVGAGADIVSVVVDQPPLEEVYLRLVKDGR